MNRWKVLSLVGLLSLVVLCNSCKMAVPRDTVYVNPVIEGALPDPSVIRVDDTYYATGTSFNFAPLYPLFESKDLVNWTRIGAVFNRPPEWTSKHFWAPELYYHDGLFYAYYTAKRKDTNIACIGVATTDDPRKGFTDHGILLEWGEEAIDSFVFQDDDGRLYVSWKAYGLTPGREIELLCSELSPDGLELVGEVFSLTDPKTGWEGGGGEGQCMIKRNGYYYLLYSAGGCCHEQCNYHIRVARSKSLQSGWEQCPDTILEGGELWKCTGHGTLVQTPDGRDFYMYHAYHGKDFMYAGRQGLLNEMKWNDETGWPYFENRGKPTMVRKTPFERTMQKRQGTMTDDLTDKANLANLEWDILVAEPETAITKGQLRITPGFTGYSFVGVRPKCGDYVFEVEVALTESLNGIGIYTFQDRLIALATNTEKVVVYTVEGDKKTVLAEVPVDGENELSLRYEAVHGGLLKFHWAGDDGKWKQLFVDGKEIFDAQFLKFWGFSPRVGCIVDGKEGVESCYKEAEIRYQF